MQFEVRRSRVALPTRGAEFALVDWGGEGPLCLFTHANGFCADTFGLVAERLRERYRVVGFDSRGHGDSTQLPAPDAYEWEEFTEHFWQCIQSWRTADESARSSGSASS